MVSNNVVKVILFWWVGGDCGVNLVCGRFKVVIKI